MNGVIKKTYYFCFLSTTCMLMLSSNLFSQAKFEKTIPAAKGYAAQQTTDGGYAVMGFTYYGVGIQNFYLAKLDSAGTTIKWAKTYGGTGIEGANDDMIFGQQTIDGGYIIAGNTQSFGVGLQNIYVVKADASGNLQWSKTLGGTQVDNANYIRQTADGGYIMTGYTTSFDNPNLQHLILIKTDSVGNLQWSKMFANPYSDERGKCVQQTVDGGYIIIGFAGLGPGGDGGDCVIKTDASGNIQWSKMYGTTKPIQPLNTADVDFNSIQQTADGGYIISGEGDSTSQNALQGNEGAALIKIDSVGDPQWTTVYSWPPVSSGFMFGNSVQVLPGGDYVVCGTYDTSSYGSEMCIFRADNLGKLKWERTFPGGQTAEGNSISLAKDGGFVLGGYIPAGHGNNLFVIKTDSIGSSSCASGTFNNFYSITPAVATCSFVVTAPTLTVTTPATIVTTPPPLLHLPCYCYTRTAKAYSDTSICYGAQVTLSAVGTPPGTIFSWNSGETTSSIMVAPPSTYTFIATVSDSNWCTAYASVEVKVHKVNAQAATNEDTLCNGNNAVLTATGGTSYVWTNGSTSSTITVVPSTTTTYSVFITDTTGCMDTAAVNIAVNPYPVVNATNATICAGQNLLHQVIRMQMDMYGTRSRKHRQLSFIQVLPLLTL